MSTEEVDAEAKENSSREKTTQWLEDVLQTYWTYKEKKKKSEAGSTVPESTTPVRVTVMDFDIGAGYSGEGRLTTLSDLLSLKVWFRIEGCDEEKTENLIVKIPPNDLADREMAHLAQVDKREIHFYTESLIQMEDWAKSRGADIKLSVPQCYFAKYHTQPKEEGPSLSDAESVLVLEDLRPIGFAMKDFGTGLGIDETTAALREIATVHALSWAMQEVSGEPLDVKWEYAYRPSKAASAYKVMIEQGFPTLADFLEKKKPDGTELLGKLRKLHPRAAELLRELLEPPPPPAPSCLTHMDFWCNNLLFRKRTPPEGAETEGAEPESESANANSASENVQVECRILDWQMMAVSRPTHDVALLLFTSLTPDTRVKNLEAFLTSYWTAFQETAKKVGVEIPFDYECIQNEYKKSQLLALLLVIGSIDLALDLESTEERLMEALRTMAEQEII